MLLHGKKSQNSLLLGVLLVILALGTSRAQPIPIDSTRQERIAPGTTQEQFNTQLQTFRAAGEVLYNALNAVWTSNSGRAEAAKKFIAEHTEYEYWVRTGYQSMLASYDKLGFSDSIRIYAPRWVHDYPNDPFALAGAAYFCLYYDLDTVHALDYARRALRLLDAYKSHPYFSPQQYSLDAHGLFNATYLTLAWGLIKLNRVKEAMDTLRSGLKNTPSTMDDQFSPAPYYYLFGKAFERNHENDSALYYYALAHQFGEGRNRWTMRADQDFITLYTTLHPGATVPSDSSAATRNLWNQRMRESMHYRGFYFEDITNPPFTGLRSQRVAWGDMDNDNYPDLLLDGCLLFHNEKGKSFTRLDSLLGGYVAQGGVWGDYDNDGWLDFYSIYEKKGDQLWHNEHNGTFRNVTAEVGNPTTEASTEGAAWVDYDADGWLDLYCANYEKWSGNASMPFADEFYHNLGGKQFVKNGAAIGVVEPDGQARAARGVAPCDFDQDGDMDMYISNYRLADNFLFENSSAQRKAGKDTAGLLFRNTAGEHGIAGVNVGGYYGHTTGSDWGDYDNDGDFDLITPNIAHPRYIDFSNRTMLYENLGAPDFKFRERRAEAGIVYEETHSDAGFADFDGDGWLDIYITSTYEDRRSFLYLNNHDGTFRQVTGLVNARVMDGFGWAVADFDLDGDLDLAVGTGAVYKTGFRIFRNMLNDNPATRIHWLEVRVKGKKGNIWGFGAVVKARQGTLQQMRTICGGRGTASQDFPIAYFGFGKNDAPVELEVTLPGGKKLTQKVTKLDRVIVIEE